MNPALRGLKVGAGRRSLTAGPRRNAGVAAESGPVPTVTPMRQVTPTARAVSERLEPRTFFASHAGVAAPEGDARPDLTGWIASATPPQVLPGGTVRLAVGVMNVETAGAASPPARLGLYLSTDTTLDGSERQIATVPVRSLRPGRQAFMRLNRVTVPADLAPGTYHYVGRVDDGGIVDEQSEADNVFHTRYQLTVVAPTVDIVPLAVTGIRVRDSRASGFFGGATLHVWNTGNTDYSGELVLRGYATDDGVPGPILSAADVGLEVRAGPVKVRAGRGAKLRISFFGFPGGARHFVMFLTAGRHGDPTPDQHVTAFAPSSRR